MRTAGYSLFMSKTMTDRTIRNLQGKLTAMRKTGLSYDLPEVQKLLAEINRLCNQA